MAVNFALFFYILNNVALNYFTREWANSSPEAQHKYFSYFCLFIYGLAIMSALFLLLQTVILVISGNKVSRALHNSLIEKLFRAPINLFYDVTPIGVILNRFSKDICVIDREIFFDTGTFLTTFY